MKKISNILFTLGLLCIVIGLVLLKKNDIINIYNNYKQNNKKEVTLGSKNTYFRNYDFNLVQNTTNFSPHNYQDILNIYYTVLNAGKTSFTFYCPEEYKTCVSDVKTLANSKDTLSDINNYVHPYNSFNHIESEYNSLGKVTITIVHKYTENEINTINNKIDELYPYLVNDNNSITDNIKSVHDYIINNSKYDSEKSDNNISNYASSTAYGPLFQGYALCEGYTDLMELFLEKIKVKNFRVASSDHIWNAVYINNTWLNLDLTWDDPIASDGKDYLEYNYFLIDTSTLLQEEKTQHNFNVEHYTELKTA